MNEKSRTTREVVAGTEPYAGQAQPKRLKDLAAGLTLLNQKKPKAPPLDPYNKELAIGGTELRKTKRRTLDDMRQLSKAIEATKTAEPSGDCESVNK